MTSRSACLPGLYHAVAADPAGDRVPRAGRRPLGPAARPPAAAHGAGRLAVPDLARLQRLRRRPERDPGQLVPVLAAAARLAEGPAAADGVEDDHEAALPFSRWLCPRPAHAADHRRRARPPAALDAAQVPRDRLPRPQRVLRAGHLRPAASATATGAATSSSCRRTRSTARCGSTRPERDRDDRLRRARGALRLRAGRGRLRRLLLPQVARARYVAATGTDYDRVRWLFRGTGIGPGQAFGFAGSESDRIDPELTPARPRRRGPGDHPRQLRRRSTRRSSGRAAGRGQVFATGNYSFLRMGRGITYKLLDNVWAKLVLALLPRSARGLRRLLGAARTAGRRCGSRCRSCRGARSGEGEPTCRR